jgi:hypothetical protein
MWSGHRKPQKYDAPKFVTLFIIVPDNGVDAFF